MGANRHRPEPGHVPEKPPIKLARQLQEADDETKHRNKPPTQLSSPARNFLHAGGLSGTGLSCFPKEDDGGMANLMLLIAVGRMRCRGVIFLHEMRPSKWLQEYPVASLACPSRALGSSALTPRPPPVAVVAASFRRRIRQGAKPPTQEMLVAPRSHS